LSDREKFKRDHDYLEQLFDRVLESLVASLNNYHGVQHSNRYWRIVLGPWLLTYLPAVWSRWECLRIAFEQYTVRDFVNIAAEELGIKLKLKWNGTGIDEMAIDVTTGKTIVQIDSRYFRPTEVETLLGDSTKAREKLGWVPKISFKELVKEMVLHDFNEAKKDNLCNQEGFATYNYQE